MGLIRATTKAIRGALAEQWLEVFEATELDSKTLFCAGTKTRNGGNVKGADNVISNGSIIHVYDNQFMFIVDGGRVVDYTSVPGYYKVDSSSTPSLFNGEFKDSLMDSFERIKFGGDTSRKQKVYYVNLQEITGIKFGTQSPINYFDNFYNAELFLRTFGNYSIKIKDPLKFYAEVVPKNADIVDTELFTEQYLSEFMEALQTAIGRLSVDGYRISHIQAKGETLSNYMQDILDEEWERTRGIEIQSVGISNFSYDEESQRLINMRNQGAMLSDPSIREGYMQGALARGLEAAGSNEGGAVNAFMGMGLGMGMQPMGMQPMSYHQPYASMPVHREEPKQDSSTDLFNRKEWICECGAKSTGNFCSNCGKPKKQKWQCSCGHMNDGKFCSNCGASQASISWLCSCGELNTGKFCPNCGKGRE